MITFLLLVAFVGLCCTGHISVKLNRNERQENDPYLKIEVNVGKEK